MIDNSEAGSRNRDFSSISTPTNKLKHAIYTKLIPENEKKLRKIVNQMLKCSITDKKIGVERL